MTKSKNTQYALIKYFKCEKCNTIFEKILILNKKNDKIELNCDVCKIPLFEVPEWLVK